MYRCLEKEEEKRKGTHISRKKKLLSYYNMEGKTLKEKTAAKSWVTRMEGSLKGKKEI